MSLPGLQKIEDVATPENEIVNVVTSGMHPTREGSGKVRVKKIAGKVGFEIPVQKWRQILQNGVSTPGKGLAGGSRRFERIGNRREAVAIWIEDMLSGRDVCRLGYGKVLAIIEKDGSRIDVCRQTKVQHRGRALG
jgi:hypothetical protein